MGIDESGNLYSYNGQVLKNPRRKGQMKRITKV